MANINADSNRLIVVLLAILAINSTSINAEGVWGQRTQMLEANSEFAVAHMNGELYILGGYPANRETQRTVQIYNIREDKWRLGPDLPLPNNHGASVSVDNTIYLIGGQTAATSNPESAGFVDTVYALTPGSDKWVAKASMPTRRAAHVAVVLDGKIYVAGGRPPRGADFAVYDPAADRWQTLPDLPTKTNHMAGAAIDGRIHIVGGRLGGNYESGITDAHVIYDPKTNEWTQGPSLPRPRSGINGVMALGCFHVWGGEGAQGMFPDHDVYNPVTRTWTSLSPMPLPVHGVTGAAFDDGAIRIPGGGDEVGGSSGTLLNQTYVPDMNCLNTPEQSTNM